MALPDSIKLVAPTERNTGISGVFLLNNANFLGSAIIQNDVNLDMYADIEVKWQYNTNPTIGKPLSVYIIYALDGTNYEDGAGIANGTGDVDPPASSYVGAASVMPDTSGHRTLLKNILLEPLPMKILIMNDATGQTASGVTLTMKTYNASIVD